MKIIQIVGRSNSGKTTFIRNLIPELKKIGKVGIIKHLGDHNFILEDGKDTTLFFQTDADITTGIDAHKTVMAIKNNILDDTLHTYLVNEIDFAVIEGYKEREFAKIVIGSLEVDRCILKNPTLEEVIHSIHCFDDFYEKKTDTELNQKCQQ
jgi:molybdopterin-guanine dinucleotide biosynthesis protein MobB